MATRKETAERKAKLRRDLRGARGGAGAMAQSQRELARRYGLSQFTVSQEVKKLASEGVLHSVERVGTFVGTPTAAAQFYLFAVKHSPTPNPQERRLQDGFEEVIATRGGSVLRMSLAEIVARVERDSLPPLAGVFDLIYRIEEHPALKGRFDGLPRVSVASRFETRPGHDLVAFDDCAGGALATRHLLRRGHRNIAFVGVHSPQQESSLVDWSAEREAGWQATMESEGLEWRELSFHPDRDIVSNQAQREASVQTARPLLSMPAVTAVVAANDDVALGLLEALRGAGVPPHRWPSIIGFDNEPLAGDQLLTSVRPPFEQLGAAAAQLLWQRHHGLAPPEPQQTRVPMKLVPRLSCHLDWSGQFEPASAPPPFGALITDIYDAPKGGRHLRPGPARSRLSQACEPVVSGRNTSNTNPNSLSS